MPGLGVSAGSVAMILLFVVGVAFLFAPKKANELFGTYVTQEARPLGLRIMGLIFMIFALFFESAILVTFSK
jgi:hypothetical protein